MKRLTTLAIASTQNIDVTLNEGNALIVQLTGNSSYDGTVDLQTSSDGPNYLNHPYESLHVAAPSRSIAQLTSISTRTSYLIVPPARQCRIKITDAGTGNLDVTYQEVALPFDPAGSGPDLGFLATVGGALDDAAAAGDPTSSDTGMAYWKQILNILMGSTGIVTWPTAAAPGNGVSMAEAIRDIHLRQSRVVSHIDFWSEMQALVTITATKADLTLPDVVVSGIPSGATIHRVIGLFKYRSCEDTSTSDNKINDDACNNPSIGFKEACSCNFVSAIDITEGTVAVTASSIEGGDVWIGDTDIKAEVTGDATYNAEFTDADADGANLLMNDVQVGLRIYFTL